MIYKKVASNGRGIGLLKVAWHWAWREWQQGEVRLLAIALLVAVAALASVGFLAERVSATLEQEARQWLGADLLLTADAPWPEEWRQEASRRGLRQAETRVFPSMIQWGQSNDAQVNRSQLVDLKAVSETYPLRGELRVAHLGEAEGTTGALAPEAAPPMGVLAKGVPQKGTVWMEAALAQRLKLQPGDEIGLGESRLRLAAWLLFEPDRGVNLMAVAPRLMMNLDDLPATGLIQPGARVAYRWLLAAPSDMNAEDGTQVVSDFNQWLHLRLGRGQRLEDLDNARPEIRSAMERAERFLKLSAMLAVVLATVVLAIAWRRYLQRHRESFAVLRVLGMTHREIVFLVLFQVLFLSSVASLAGVGLGYGVHMALISVLRTWVSSPLAQVSHAHLWKGWLLGAILLLSLVWPSLRSLRNVAPQTLLRRTTSPFFSVADAGTRLSYAISALLILVLWIWNAGSLVLAAMVAGGLLSLVLLFWGLIWGGWRVGLAWERRRIRGEILGKNSSRWPGWHSLRRHPRLAAAQTLALAVGLTVLILMLFTRGELLRLWEGSVPPQAHNRFVINIQPEQAVHVREFLSQYGVAGELFPMVRARWTHRIRPGEGEKAIRGSDYSDERAQRLAEREFNLSWSNDLPEGNRVSAGRWFNRKDRAAISIESGLADKLDIRVGDRLRFSVAGETIEVDVIGLRKVSWDNMRVNFFALTSPGVLENFPASFITSFHLPQGDLTIQDRLVALFPNLSVIDLGAILGQLRRVSEQVGQASALLLGFVLAAGALVLLAVMQVSADERRYEIGILRALGATRGELRRELVGELLLIGAAAGGLAGLAGEATGMVIGYFVFAMDTLPQLLPALWRLPLWSAGAALGVACLGWRQVNRWLESSPLSVLRCGE